MNNTKLLLTVGSLICFSCEKIEPVLDNPYDPENPDYVPPETEITSGPVDGVIISEQTVLFQWDGSKPIMLFSYSFDGAIWSVWSTQAYTQFDYLDEGDHIFIVKGKYPGGEEESIPDTAVFTVDAISGPSLRFYPLYTRVVQNEQFTLDIIAEEVDSVAGAEISVEFDVNYLYLDSISIGDFFSLNGGQIISFDSLRNDLGNLQLDIGTLGGNPVYVEGTGVVVQLHFKSLKHGKTEITFGQNSTLRKPDNQVIGILNLVKADVRIEWL